MSASKRRILIPLLFVSIMLVSSSMLFGCSFDISTYIPEYDNGYEITNYVVNIDVNEDKSMTIQESITANFFEYSRGIYRYIPLTQSIGVPNGDGTRTVRNYENEISNFVYKNGEILDEFEEEGYQFYALEMERPMSSGSYTFEISYDVSSVDDRDTEKDFFYQNIIGTGWDTNILNTSFTITFPKTFESNPLFYVGTFGENIEGTQVEYKTYEKEVEGETKKVIEGSYGLLEYGEAITIYLPLEQGYFTFTRSYLFDIALVVLAGVFLLFIIFIAVKFRKKDPIIDVVEFSAPDNLTPTEAGYIIDKSLHGKDISSLIVYWADKGYVKLEEKDKKVYAQKIKELPENAKTHEKIFFSTIFHSDSPIDVGSMKFEGGYVGEAIRRSIAKEKKNFFEIRTNKFYNIAIIFLFVLTLLQCARIAFASVDTFSFVIKIVVTIVMALAFLGLTTVQNGQHKESRKKQLLKRSLIFLLIIACHMVFIFYAEGYNDPFFTRFYFPILSIILFFVYLSLEHYTKLGRECLGKLRGLRQYILVAEKDRFEMLAKENPEIFFHVLPYAYVLGVSDTYLEKFADVPIGDPKWMTMSDGMTVWLVMSILDRNILALSMSLNNTLAKNIVKSFVKNASRSAVSRIGGGGGFSGGGSGGGGGGRF